MQRNMKLRPIALAISSFILLAASQVAMADSTDDLLKKLHDKGILSDQEYNDFNTTRDTEQDKRNQEKLALNKGKINLGKFIDNATIYGDIRVRYEHRDGEDTAVPQISQDRDRGRYKLTLGIKTEPTNFFYTDLALAMGSGGRSDNATFGTSNGGAPGNDNKEILFVKRALIGWHGVDWLTVEAGRVANPLYTTEMVWDRDLNFEGLTEQLNYTLGSTELFGNLVQSHYSGDSKQYQGNVGSGSDSPSSFLMAFQGGAKFKLTDELSAKAALTYYTYTHDSKLGLFSPGRGSITGTAPTFGGNVLAYNDLRPLELPFEVSYKATEKISVTGFGDFVHNIDGSDRQSHACGAPITASYTALDKTAVCSAGTDDNAWLLGLGIKSAGKSPAAGDWEAKVWYQDVGIYAVDPNSVDSDFMDSRVNMKGVVFKGGYYVEDNVVMNVSAGHASRKNKNLAAVGSGTDLSINTDDYNLLQLDLTYKF